MFIYDVNWLGIFVAALISFVVGWMWFGPIFGKIWMKAMKLTEKQFKEMNNVNIAIPMSLGFGMALLGTFVIAVLMINLDVVTLGEAMTLGFWVWLGFLFTTHFGNNMWENKDLKIFYLYASHDLVRIWIICFVLYLFG